MPLRALPPEDSVSAISPLGQEPKIKIQNCSTQINPCMNFRVLTPRPTLEKVRDAAHGKTGAIIYFCSQTEILYLCHRTCGERIIFVPISGQRPNSGFGGGGYRRVKRGIARQEKTLRNFSS